MEGYGVGPHFSSQFFGASFPMEISRPSICPMSDCNSLSFILTLLSNVTTPRSA